MLKMQLRRMIITALVAVLSVSGLGIVTAAQASQAVTAPAATPQEDGQAWLGVAILDEEAGVTITDVSPDSPAEEAGLQVGDIILSLDDTAIESGQALITALQDYAPGDSVTLTINRDGEEQDVALTLGTRPENLPAAGELPIIPMGAGMLDFLGMQAQQADNGWQVESVEDGSVLADAGLRAGDLITAVNGQAIDEMMPHELMQILGSSTTISLTVERDGEELTLDVTLPDEMPFDEMDDMMGGLFQMDSMAQEMLGSLLDIDLSGAFEGVRVERIGEDSPLAGSALQEGDVVTAINGTPLAELDYQDVLNTIMAGETITLTIQRMGEEMEIEVTINLNDLPGGFERIPEGMRPPQFDPGPGNGGMWTIPQAGQPTQLGVTFSVITPDLAAEEGLDVEQGALIREVFENTPAAGSGLEAGDIITAVENDVVDEEHTLRDRLYAYEEGDMVTLSVIRDGSEISIEVVLGPNPRDAMAFQMPGGMGPGGMMIPFGGDNSGSRGMWRFSVPNGHTLDDFLKDHGLFDEDMIPHFTIPDLPSEPSQALPDARQA